MKNPSVQTMEPEMYVRQKKKKSKAFLYLLVLPTMILLGVFTFYPFLKAIYLTFFVTSKTGAAGAYVGLRNYIKVLTSAAFLNTMRQTMLFALLVGCGTFVLSMVFAFLCVSNVKGSKVYQTMYALPISLASVPVSAIALYIFSADGLLNSLIGTSNAWLSEKSTALIVCAIVTIWSGVGSSFIFLLVGFRNVDVSLVESARIDGASYLTRFFKIYLPIASPQIFFVIFLNIIRSFKSFAIIKLLTGTGPENSTDILIYEVYSQAFQRGRFETACVYAVVLCLLIFVFTRIQLLFEKKVVHYQ